jgi:hypothetical protein
MLAVLRQIQAFQFLFLAQAQAKRGIENLQQHRRLYVAHTVHRKHVERIVAMQDAFQKLGGKRLNKSDALH